MQQEDARVLATVRRLWQGLASPTARFSAGRVAVVVNAGSMACPPGWIGVVEIDGSALAIVPDEDTARRLAIEDESPRSVGTVEFLRSRVQVAEVLGPATLDYLLPGRFRPADEIDVVASKASDPAIESLLSKVGDDEASESGIFGITSPLFSVREHGRVLAVAGYRSWPLGVAHVTALTAPEARGTGLATRLASTAVEHALAAGLLPQWRAADTNPGSRAVARKLGFSAIGRQLSARPVVAEWPAPSADA
ncbi:GNAT family N-acetyltransferase [Plantibacter flavus]|uniref:GNAT family N-acetyltransferase n=1 Tax=Plantibacter flavus TaxID=150123 RepID=UPI00237927C2|nr:GNAT family N-acetyltransferase [Plantibacter flavus]MDD9153946.1 GNAT family N-acetyltransferase [Plantibacter flavus]